MKDKRIKAMEPEVASAEAKKEASAAPTLSFTDWFSVKLREHKKLRPGHYEPIKAFFTNNNLKENETKEAFDAMLKIFGY